MILSFSVPGIPRPKARPRLGKGGHIYTPDRTAKYEDSVRVYAMQAIAKCGWRTDPVARYALTVRVYQVGDKRLDLDNVVKAISDSLNKLAFDDDSQIDKISAVRTRDSAVTGGKPSVEVEVQRM